MALFRGDIRNAFGSLRIPDINLPDTNIAFPAIEFPTINLPDINIGNPLQGVSDAIQDVIPDPFVGSERQDVPFGDSGQVIDVVPDTTGGRAERLRGVIGEFTNSGVFTPEGDRLPDERPLNLGGFLNNIIPQAFAEEDRTPQGGDFVGGTIFETPIDRLSLSQIIDRFNVSASQAANIRDSARDNFGDFDFGTNTGSGIGSLLSNLEINPALPSGGAVSNPLFEGLSAEEIAQRLTGGIINNF